MVWALEYVGARVDIAKDPEQVCRPDPIVLSGGDAFASGMREFGTNSLDQALIDVTKTGRPLLGTCLGI